MTIPFQTISQAFDFVNFGSPYEHEAYVCRQTGESYYHSELIDNEEELPEDIGDDEKYIGIPHKNELNLGRDLVFEFTQDHLPEKLEKVRSIFQRKGAYARFKDLLEQEEKLEEWYAFEEKRTEEVLRQWCKDNGLEVSG